MITLDALTPGTSAVIVNMLGSEAQNQMLGRKGFAIGARVGVEKLYKLQQKVDVNAAGHRLTLPLTLARLVGVAENEAETGAVSAPEVAAPSAAPLVATQKLSSTQKVAVGDESAMAQEQAMPAVQKPPVATSVEPAPVPIAPQAQPVVAPAVASPVPGAAAAVAATPPAGVPVTPVAPAIPVAPASVFASQSASAAPAVSATPVAAPAPVQAVAPAPAPAPAPVQAPAAPARAEHAPAQLRGFPYLGKNAFQSKPIVTHWEHKVVAVPTTMEIPGWRTTPGEAPRFQKAVLDLATEDAVKTITEVFEKQAADGWEFVDRIPVKLIGEQSDTAKAPEASLSMLVFRKPRV